MTGGRARVPHPVVVLWWLRAGVLGMVAVTTVLYLVVANGASKQIAASHRTEVAIGHIAKAQNQAGKAQTALEAVFHIHATELIGTGGDFANATARVGSHLTSATEGNAAGKPGLSHIQFVQGQLATYVQLAETAVSEKPTDTAVHDDPPGLRMARAALDTAPQEDGRKRVGFTGGLKQSLKDLQKLETEANEGRRHSGWRDPGLLWPLFAGPVTVMLLLVCATGYIIVHHFRRYPNPTLVVAFLATASVGVSMCTVAPPHAAIVLPALAVAGVLAYLTYRPRLAEYRFPRP